MNTHSTIPVSTEQAERAAAIMVADNISYDTLVSLALDAYEIMGNLSPHVPEMHEWRYTHLRCINGEHYVEVTSGA